MSTQKPTFVDRVKQAAEILNVKEDDLTESLKSYGFTDSDMGLKLLNASTTKQEHLTDVFYTIESEKERLQDHKSHFVIMAAAALLKGEDPFAEEEKDTSKVSDSGISDLAKVFQDSRPIEQRKDQEVLEIFAEDRDVTAEEVLRQRCKGQRFIILKSNEGNTDPGKEEIDIEQSLVLLKKTRKMKIPTIIPGEGNKVLPVYRLEELDMSDRIVELCPICGEVLFRGYCEKCALNFSDVNEDARAFVALVVKSETTDIKSHSDRKALFASAIKGVMDLRQTWPSIDPLYRKLKMENDLPRLKMIKPLPSDQVKDPFGVNGNRSY